MDLISELPEGIKHRIIYFLKVDEAARTAVLSKAWKSTFDSRPVVEFDNQQFHGRNFVGFMEKCLQRFSRKGVSVQELKLRLNSCRSMRTADLVSRWIRLASKTNLKELEISFINPSVSYNFNVLSSDTLTKLTLHGFELTGVPAGRWRFRSLRSIALSSMILDTAVVEDLVAASPLLEVFTVFFSKGLTGLEFPCLGRLRRADISLPKGFRQIALLGASSLESVTIFGNSEATEIEIEGAGRILKDLHVTGVPLTTNWVQTRIAKLARLEVLNLSSILGLETFRISCTQLTKLSVERCEELGPDTEIYAPNLRNLEFRDNKFPFYSLPTSLSLESVEFRFQLAQATAGSHKSVWFDKLRELFDKAHHVDNLVVSIVCYKPKIAIFHKGLSDSLFRVIFDLDDTVLGAQVTISSYLNWDTEVMSPETTNEVYIAPSFDIHNSLSEYLLNKLPIGRVKSFKSSIRIHNHILYSCKMEILNGWSEFGGDVDTKHALLQAYGASPLRLNRFSLVWSNLRYLPLIWRQE